MAVIIRVRVPLASMKYEEYPIGAPLSAFIKKLWTLDNSDAAVASGERSVLPSFLLKGVLWKQLPAAKKRNYHPAFIS
jgi:hypothetical protein